MKPKRSILVALLVIAAAITWQVTRPAQQGDGVSQTASDDSRRSHPAAVGENGSSGDDAGSPPTSGRDASRPDDRLPDGPSVTRSRQRETVVSPSGKRLVVTDPMASWNELPAWPEGPRLFAEVDTASRRYVNLRPDDAGEMPRIRAEAEERIELRVNFPEGEPGEKIFVELPNGGSFADSDARGRVLELPENRTLSFPYITDDERGHCNVKLRHRGHTRSLPIWIGELPEPPEPDTGS